MARKTFTSYVFDFLCRTAECRFFLTKSKEFYVESQPANIFLCNDWKYIKPWKGRLNEETSLCFKDSFRKYAIITVEKLHWRSCKQIKPDLWNLFSYSRSFSLNLRRVPSSSSIVLHHKKKSTTPDLSFVYTGKDTGRSLSYSVVTLSMHHK